MVGKDSLSEKKFLGSFSFKMMNDNVIFSEKIKIYSFI